MARQLIVLKHCDMCLMEDPEHKVEAMATELIAIGSMRERQEIDLCPDHDEMFLEPVRQVVKLMGHSQTSAQGNVTAPDRPKVGTKPGWGKTVAKTQPECYLCGHTAETGAGIDDHMRRIHGIPMQVFYGNTCPICGVEFKSNLGVHSIRTHSMRTVNAFRAAEAMGDPHGVVSLAKKRAEAAKPRVNE